MEETSRTVRDRLTDAHQTFTKSDAKVVRELLANYPVGGLTTVSSLARRAGVSDPTVVRLACKLGYDGFGDLQQHLLREVEAHLNSPLTLLAGRRNDTAPRDNLPQYLEGVALSTRVAAHAIVPGQFEAAADLLASPQKRVLCLGGRFSRHLAAILRLHLQHLRPRVDLLAEPETELGDYLVDIRPSDVLVVYDFRRYQANVVFFAKEAHARGCKVILVTDEWRSPIDAVADIVFPLQVQCSSPFDTMVPALALTEALVSAAAMCRAGKLDQRLEELESIRSKYKTGA